MKILIATPIYPPDIGGPATYTKEISLRLQERGHEIAVIAFANDSTCKENTEENVSLVSRKNFFLKRHFLFFLEVFNRCPYFDFVYMHEPSATGLVVLAAAKLRRKKTILKFVGDRAWESASRDKRTDKLLDDFLSKSDAGLKYFLIKKLQWIVFRSVYAIVVPSKYLKMVLVRHYGVSAKKINVIYNAAAYSADAYFFNEKVSTPRIAVVARIVPWKGIRGVIDALVLLKKELPDIKLSVAGDGPELPFLKDYVIKKEVKENVEFLGEISRKETAELRRRSSVFVLNSSYEGLPHSVLSSFAVGIPVVATDIPGTDEAVINGKTGLSVPLGDSEALARAIKKLIYDRVLAKKLTENACAFLHERFSWKGHIDSLIELLESIFFKPRN